jgi:hypothetical protein
MPELDQHANNGRALALPPNLLGVLWFFLKHLDR